MPYELAMGPFPINCFEKCGEITTTLRLGKQVYALNCIFCANIYWKLETFTLHLEQKHAKKLQQNTSEDEKVEVVECQIDLETEQTTNTSPNTKIETFELQDPLDHHLEPDAVETSYEDDTIETMEYENDSKSQINDWSEAETDVEGITGTKNEEFISRLIECFEIHRLLWDTQHAMAKDKPKRKAAYKNIAATINKEFDLNLNGPKVAEHIKELCDQYRSEHDSSPWYSSKLHFLNTTEDSKTCNKSFFTRAQNLQIIAIYKSFPCLWNTDDIGYRFKKQRQEAIEEMLQALKSQLGITFTQEELQKKLYRIRYICTQEKQHQLQCQAKKKKYTPKCKFFAEIKFLAEHVGPYQCEICSEIFNGSDQYKVHKAEHDGSTPFNCPHCQRGFTRAGNLTVHVRRHTRDYPFECRVCGKRYATSTDVNVHMRCHTGEKPYFCEICGQSFRTWTFFNSHIRRHQKRPSHKCTLCSRGFYENVKLKEHMKAHLNVRDKVCNICDKAFTCTKYLRQHKQIHAPVKKYACKICDKHFAQYAGLSGHMKSHGTTISGVTATATSAQFQISDVTNS